MAFRVKHEAWITKQAAAVPDGYAAELVDRVGLKAAVDWCVALDALNALNEINLRGRDAELRRLAWRARVATDALRIHLDPFRSDRAA